MNLMKSRKNLFEENSYRLSVNQLSLWKHATSYKINQFWAPFELQYLWNTSFKEADVLDLHK